MELTAKRFMICIVAVAAFAGAARAGDVWKEKKPADWSPKEMEKFLTRSPWARTVQPESPPPSMEQGPTSANTGGWGGGPGGGGGGAGGWRGQSGNPGGAMPITSFQVRWVSAPIMREALKVAEGEPLNAAIAKYAGDYYIISVSMEIKGGSGGGQWGSPGGRQWGNGGAGPGAPNAQSEQGRKQFEEMLLRGATLRFGGHTFHPVKAEMTPSKAGMTTLYLFPRTMKLEDAARDYVFELTQGPVVTMATFSLKGFDQAPEKGL